ncbi:hypothetical protein ACFC3Z_11735 [Enterococcus thailandicus]|uniref:hypothetical protein n=1 Tax=Enterococcus thailandicus TaxID=417368 RepID=UPI0035D58AD7
MKKYMLIVLFSSSLLTITNQVNGQSNADLTSQTKNQTIEQVHEHQDVTRIGFYRKKRERSPLLNQPVRFAPRHELKPVVTKLNDGGLQGSSLGNIYSSISGTLIFGQKRFLK